MPPSELPIRGRSPSRTIPPAWIGDVQVQFLQYVRRDGVDDVEDRLQPPGLLHPHGPVDDMATSYSPRRSGSRTGRTDVGPGVFRGHRIRPGQRGADAHPSEVTGAGGGIPEGSKLAPRAGARAYPSPSSSLSLPPPPTSDAALHGGRAFSKAHEGGGQRASALNSQNRGRSIAKGLYVL